jgi:hypothetical protein
MNWGKWIDGLLRDVGLAAIPALSGALSRAADDPGAPWWVPAAAAAALIAVKRLGNWLKHRHRPAPV